MTKIPAGMVFVICGTLFSLLSPVALAIGPLFAEDTPLELTLTGPFTQIDDERDKAQEYEGTVSYAGDSGPVTLDVKYSVRGQFRLQERVCSYSQLWLDFDKDELEGTVFAGQNKVKLALQCRDSDRYADYIVQEQQIYRMFTLLSEKSLRTRLVNVQYVDPASGESRTQRGFLIQHHKRLAEQQGLTALDAPSIDKAAIEPVQGNLVALFMYMVANTDYSLVAGKPDDDCCHNTKPLMDSDGVVYSIPYDFDSTGYVDTSYAEISAGINQRDIKQRIFRGFCVPSDVLAANLQKFRDNRDAIRAIAGEQTYVSKREAKNSTKFIDNFYKVIDSDFQLKYQIVNACRD